MRIRRARRVVIKLGTQVLMGEDENLARERLSGFVDGCAALIRGGREVLLVTSGAVGLGRQALGLVPPLTLSEKQACAAVGQSLLMENYRSLFSAHGLVTAQVLLTAEDLSDRPRYVNLQRTLEKLLELRAVPILNENDTVATAELQEDAVTRSFGDNDHLSALVAGRLSADVLLLLTNVDGIYTDNPFRNPAATRIPVIRNLTELARIGVSGRSAAGRGGMASKVGAVRVAARSGVHTVVASGLEPGIIEAVLGSGGGEDAPIPGTVVLAHESALPSRKQWIGYASGYEGVVVVDDRAREALLHHFASLLAVGICAVHGHYPARKVVSVQDQNGVEIGRGITNFSADDTRRIMGRPSSEFAALLGRPVEHDVVIQRDDLVLFQDGRA